MSSDHDFKLRSIRTYKKIKGRDIGIAIINGIRSNTQVSVRAYFVDNEGSYSGSISYKSLMQVKNAYEFYKQIVDEILSCNKLYDKNTIKLKIKNVLTKARLLGIDAFMDSTGQIKVRTRLEFAGYSKNSGEKVFKTFPLLLPDDLWFVELLLKLVNKLTSKLINEIVTASSVLIKMPKQQQEQQPEEESTEEQATIDTSTPSIPDIPEIPEIDPQELENLENLIEEE